MNANLLSEKIILITGGTSELGQAFTHQALDQGAKVYFTFFQNKEVADQLIQKGAKGFKVDFCDMRAIDELVKSIKEETKHLDVLIHNAAAIRDHTLKNLTEEEWDTVLTADLKAPYYLTKQALRLLFKSEQGKVFYLTSRVALRGGIGVSNYAAAKAGLIGLTKSLAQELGKKKILVNAINPGFMNSSMTKDLPEAVIETNLKASPLGDWSNPEEVAGFLVYLSSPLMKQVSGQVLNLESRQT